MANVISFDTEVLMSLVDSLNTAKDNIDEAVKILNKVTTHDDWYCKARDQINDSIRDNMKKALELQEMSTTFSTNVKCASIDFIEEENALIKLSDELEELLKQFFHDSLDTVNNVLNAVGTIGSQLGNNNWLSNNNLPSTDEIMHSVLNQWAVIPHQTLPHYHNHNESPVTILRDVLSDMLGTGGGNVASGGGGSGSFGGGSGGGGFRGSSDDGSISGSGYVGGGVGGGGISSW